MRPGELAGFFDAPLSEHAESIVLNYYRMLNISSSDKRPQTIDLLRCIWDMRECAASRFLAKTLGESITLHAPTIVAGRELSQEQEASLSDTPFSTIVASAVAVAQGANSTSLCSTHLLLAIILNEDCLAARFLSKHGVSKVAARELLALKDTN